MRKLVSVPLFVAMTSLSASALAGTGLQITFDEFDAINNNSGYLSNEYAGIGVTWNTTDDGSIWDGLTDGDPGNWEIDGTNGPQFLGFNGGSYQASMLFDTQVNAFQLDASRSNGSSDGDTFTVDGYLNGGLVDSVTITFLGLNEWSTVFLNGNIDEVVMYGNGSSFHPFGVDNIAWRAVPTPSTMALLGIGGLLAGRRRR